MFERRTDEEMGIGRRILKAAIKGKTSGKKTKKKKKNSDDGLPSGYRVFPGKTPIPRATTKQIEDSLSGLPDNTWVGPGEPPPGFGFKKRKK